MIRSWQEKSGDLVSLLQNVGSESVWAEGLSQSPSQPSTYLNEEVVVGSGAAAIQKVGGPFSALEDSTNCVPTSSRKASQMVLLTCKTFANDKDLVDCPFAGTEY